MTAFLTFEIHLSRHFRTIATSDMTPTAKPTLSDATRRCHSICC